MEEVQEERIATNNATFREANERISAAAGSYGIETPIPFICECSDPRCSEVIRISLDEYEEVRANSRHFLNIPGHEAASKGLAVVVERRDGYSIVEKTGRAGEIVEGLDERHAVGNPPGGPSAE
ncbi:MAG TPA: hypothetical protein VFB87_06180 [Gaiellaceae bacterium]|nr:hypothetical protein [Gaiellaceae bacterium]